MTCLQLQESERINELCVAEEILRCTKEWSERKVIIERLINKLQFKPHEIAYGYDMFPLNDAVKNRDNDFVAYLFQKGLKPQHHLTLQDGSPFVFRIRTQNIAKIFLENEADFSVKYQGKTLLHELAECTDLEDTELIAYVAKHGADVLACDAEGRTALHYVKACPDLKKIRALVNAGVPIDAQVRSGMYEGCTFIQMVKMHLKDLYASLVTEKSERYKKSIASWNEVLEVMKELVHEKFKTLVAEKFADVKVRAVLIDYYEHPEFPSTTEGLIENNRALDIKYAWLKQRRSSLLCGVHARKIAECLF